MRILGIGGNTSLDAAWTDPAARLVSGLPARCTRPGGTYEASFGTSVQILGSAYIGGCDDQQ